MSVDSFYRLRYNKKATGQELSSLVVGKGKLNMVSEAQKRAKDRYEEKAYWKSLVRFPKGLEEEIKKQKPSVNGFIVQAVIEKLARDTGSDVASIKQMGKNVEPNFDAIEPIKPKEMPEYLKMALGEMP